MKKVPTIIILLIVFCLCCGITYASIKGFSKPKDNTETKEEKKEDKKEKKKDEEKSEGKDVNVDRTKIEDAIEKIKVIEIYGKDIYPEKLTNEELLFFVYANNDFYENGLTLDAAKSFVNKYLGVELKPGSMPCPNGGDVEPALIIFDEKANKFIYNPEHDGHGGGGTELTTMNKIDNIEVSGDTIIVTVKKLFSRPFGDVDVSTLYFYNYKLALEGEKENVVYEDIDEELASDPDFDYGYNRSVSKIDYSKASTYEYKFKVVDDNYVLVSYKEIK